MKLGNVTGDIYDRSIHKKLNCKRAGIVTGAAYGEDCAIFVMDPDKYAPEHSALYGEKGSVLSGEKDLMLSGEKAPALSGGLRIAAALAQTVYTGKDCGKYAVYAAVNQAAACGAETAGILLNVLLPAKAKEPELRSVVEQAGEAAADVKTAIADVKASVTHAVNEICVTAAAVGIDRSCACGRSVGMDAAAGRDASEGKTRGNAEAFPERKAAKAEAQIVMTKWAGLEGSAILASRFPEKLRERYPSGLIEEAAAFDRFLSILPEAAAAGKSGGSVLCAAAEGGIFRALWTLAECAGVGLEIDLKKIPIRQETVEICNYLDLNPYELMANGSLLCLTEHADALLKELHREQIPAAVIGSAASGRDRVIINGEERRFLEPAKSDEIYKVI